MVGHHSVLHCVALALGLLISADSTPAKAEFNIRNIASGLVLDVIGGSTADFQNVILFPSNDRQHQLFDQNSEVDGSFSLSARHSFKCLDVIGASGENGASIVQFTCHFGPNQRWTSQRMGHGVILRAVHSGKCLDAANPNFPTPPRSEALLQQWTCISSPNDANAVNQIFQLGGF
jgi:hypothetical protein